MARGTSGFQQAERQLLIASVVTGFIALAAVIGAITTDDVLGRLLFALIAVCGVSLTAIFAYTSRRARTAASDEAQGGPSFEELAAERSKSHPSFMERTRKARLVSYIALILVNVVLIVLGVTQGTLHGLYVIFVLVFAFLTWRELRRLNA